MIRIEIDDADQRAYVLAYLQSETGQQLLTQGKTGSVIDHLSKTHVANLEIPLLEHDVRARVSEWMNGALLAREHARMMLDEALEEFEKSLPAVQRERPEKEGWTINAKDLTDRLDAASYDPLVHEVRQQLLASGGVRVDSVATVLKPTGRYKTYYVDRDYGRPILSGTQLLQARPINLRYIAPRAFTDPTKYEVRAGWLACQADGRSEEALGLPIMITDDRDRWLASGHVGRVIAKKDVNPGWLYLALRSWAAQIQIKSLASGSVVDSTFPWDMESVILPPPTNGKSGIILPMWENFAIAQGLEVDAIRLIEQSLGGSDSDHDFPVKLSKRPSPFELEFRTLVDQWRNDTQHTSSIKRMVQHPAYQRIIEMGSEVLPLLFRELNARRDHWLVALNIITGEDPALEGSTFTEAVDAWLAWGREKGYLPQSVART
jgi:hypothetical protein